MLCRCLKRENTVDSELIIHKVRCEETIRAIDWILELMNCLRLTLYSFGERRQRVEVRRPFAQSRSS